jgi:hypothetical protein
MTEADRTPRAAAVLQLGCVGVSLVTGAAILVDGGYAAQ